MTITSMAAIERRVLTLVDPDAQGNTAGTTTNLTAALHMLVEALFWFWPPVAPEARRIRVTVSTLWEAAWAEVAIPGRS